MMCFSPDCKHYSERGTCRFFRFPKDEKTRKQWIKLVRRADREPSNTSTLCSFHFKGGLKENGPTIFHHNEQKQVFCSPVKQKSLPLSEVAIAGPSNINLPHNAASSTAALCSSSSSSSASSTSTSLDNVLTAADNYFLQKDIEKLTARVEQLETSFSFKHIADKDDLVVLYTGLPNSFIFESLFELLNKVERNYYLDWKVECIEPKDQLFMTLYKLRLNAPYRDMTQRFNCSLATITNIFTTWLHILHEIIFEQLMAKVPGRSKNFSCSPECFSRFPNTRMVIDCTEIYSEVPHDTDKQRETYSSYKHRNTLKGLVGVAPNGVVTFTSQLYPGSTSDKKIVEHCGILSIFKEGDLILADKGFLIGDLLPPGVTLNTPPFLLEPQFTPEQVAATTNIAKARIHVERAIRRIKAYRILNLMPQNLVRFIKNFSSLCSTDKLSVSTNKRSRNIF